MGVYLANDMRPVNYKKTEAKFTYGYHNWQHKGIPFEKALQRTGWKKSAIPDIYLLDHDLQRCKTGSRSILKIMHEKGSMICLYPHSVLPEWWYGIDYHPDPLVAFRFQIAEAQRMAMRMTHPEIATEICGWPFSKIKEFQPCVNPENILFAPIHPPKNGSLRPEAFKANKDMLTRLSKIKDNYNIRVRYIGEMDRQGLEYVPGIEFVQGVPDGSTLDIEWSDLVISDQTFLFISAAVGKPCIGFSQDKCPRPNNQETTAMRTPQDWKKWWHLIRYPIADTDGSLTNLIKEAGTFNPVEWKSLNIGKEMRANEISAIIKRYLLKHKRRKYNA